MSRKAGNSPLQQHCYVSSSSLGLSWFYLGQAASEDMVIRVVELAHQPVDIGWRIPTNVGDKESNELGGHIVEHRTVNVDLLQNVPCKTITC